VFAEAGHFPKAGPGAVAPRAFGAAARGFVEFETRTAAQHIATSHLENQGEAWRLAISTLTGPSADRIDILKDGRCAILDYKTGAISDHQNRWNSFCRRNCRWKPAMLAQGGFPQIGKRIAEDLIYLSLASEKKRARHPAPDRRRGWAWASEAVTQFVAADRLVFREKSHRLSARAYGPIAPILRATTTIWRGCGNGHLPAWSEE